MHSTTFCIYMRPERDVARIAIESLQSRIPQSHEVGQVVPNGGIVDEGLLAISRYQALDLK